MARAENQLAALYGEQAAGCAASGIWCRMRFRPAANQVVIYSNADDEAVAAMKDDPGCERL